MPPATDPTDPTVPQMAPRLTIASSYTDPRTGALYVHADLEQVIPDWEVERHISPIKRTEQFGDVESWAEYILRFGCDSQGDSPPLLTWSESGLTAILDYHSADGTPGRCAWLAVYEFRRSAAWTRWSTLANSRPRTQRDLLEALEDLAEDITDPAPADLVSILRTMRTTASATAETELQADGSTTVRYAKSSAVNVGANLQLPPIFTITIPVLVSHTASSDTGKPRPVVYELPVRIRASVDDNAHLALRLSMPTAERVLEAVYADRVAAAEALMNGAGHRLYRAVNQ